MVGKSDLILLLGAIVIFSLLTVNVNAFLFNASALQVDTELQVTAVSLAQGIINAAREKDYDENTTNGQTPSAIPSGFSSTLGPDNGETFSSYNDFDDYNGYNIKDTTDNGIYTTTVTVNYVDSTDFTQVSSVQTTYKRMVVQVTNPSMADTVRLSYIKSYY